jgi:hypothetical protein
MFFLVTTELKYNVTHLINHCPNDGNTVSGKYTRLIIFIVFYRIINIFDVSDGRYYSFASEIDYVRKAAIRDKLKINMTNESNFKPYSSVQSIEFDFTLPKEGLQRLHH